MPHLDALLVPLLLTLLRMHRVLYQKEKIVCRNSKKRRRIETGRETEPTSLEFSVPDKFKSVTHAGHEVRFLLHKDFRQIDEFEEDSDNDKIIVLPAIAC